MPPTTTPPAGLQYARPQEAPTPTVRAPEGIVVAVVSVTGTVDEVNDLIVPGAYARTLAELTPKVIKEHQWPDVIGRVLHIEELMPGDSRLPPFTGRGKPWPAEAGALVATIQFNLNTDLGRTAFENARFFGKEQQFSIGYKVVPARTRRRRDGVRVIGDLDLWEISTVLWGAHLDTLLLDVKSAQAAARKADKKLRDAVDTEMAAEADGEPGEASDAAGVVVDAEKAAEDADKAETGLVAEKAVALDMSDSAQGLAARKRAAQKLRAAARARARRAKDKATLVEMDRRDEWDRAIELETLEEQKRRSAYRRKYKLTRQDRNRRVDLAEDERVRRAQWQAQMKRWVRVEKARRRKWSMSMRARSDAFAAAVRSIEAKTARQLVDEVKAGVPGVADTPEDRKRVRHLIRWYERGEGAALIQWGVEGDHYRCVAIAGKHMTTEQAHGFCNLRHKGALGTYSGDHDGDGKPDHLDRKTHPGGLEWKSMVQMRGSFEERQRKLEQAVQTMFCPKPVEAGPMDASPDSGWASVDATFDTKVYVTVYKDGGTESFEVPYSFDTEGEVALGEPSEVELSVVATPEGGMTPEPMSEVDAAAARYLTPVLTGYGELALATKTAALGLEGKGSAWKQAIADAVQALISAAEDAGISLDDPDEPDMDDDTDLDTEVDDADTGGMDGEDTPEADPIADEQAAAADDDAYSDEDGMADDDAVDGPADTAGAGDMSMPGMDESESAGFGVLGDSDPTAGGEAEDEGDMDAPMTPDEPGVPDSEPDMDADDDGTTDGMETAEDGAPVDEQATTDPTGADAEAGDKFTDTTADPATDEPMPDDTDDTDAEDDEDGEGKPWEKKTLTIDPAQVIADLENLRKATS